MRRNSLTFNYHGNNSGSVVFIRIHMCVHISNAEDRAHPHRLNASGEKGKGRVRTNGRKRGVQVVDPRGR